VAGPAYAGIPVTHRAFVSSVHIVTGHAKNNEDTNINFEALVRAGGTLVFMMGVGALEEICKGCIAAGMDKDMPAAIVENATTNTQRKFIGTVESLPETARENHVKSPAVIIVGKVCSFSEEYDWFSQKPLLGKSIIVAKAKQGPSKLSEGLRELGCRVIELPGAEIVPLTTTGCQLEQALQNIKDYSWLVFTSGVGVNVFFDYLIDNEFDVRELYHLKIACVGSETEREIKKYGIITDYIPGEYSGAALAHGLCGLVRKDERILIARDKDGASDLPGILSDAGLGFDDAAIYEKRRGPDKRRSQDKRSSAEKTCGHGETIDEIIELIDYRGCYAAFTSSSAVDGFAGVTGDVDHSGIKAICIGEKTAAAARVHGMDVYISEKATIESMIKKAEEVMK
jgi:uroporphyrinogen III methyltransferase/synthase